MKLLILLSTIALSSEVMSAEFLLKFTQGSGFGPFVSRSDLTVAEDGTISKFISQARSVKMVKVGKLSSTAVATLKDKIETIADNGKLINLDAQKPGCMDAPSTSLIVNKGGKEITIAAWRNCQRFQTNDLETKSLSSLAQSFDYLAE